MTLFWRKLGRSATGLIRSSNVGQSFGLSSEFVCFSWRGNRRRVDCKLSKEKFLLYFLQLDLLLEMRAF
jgi:hypothetical protein